MLYHVQHVTEYHYQDAVSLCHNLVHLKPRWTPNQVCHRTHLHVEPKPTAIEPMLDYFGNPTAHFTIQNPHKVLKVMAHIVVEVHPRSVANLSNSPGVGKCSGTDPRIPRLADFMRRLNMCSIRRIFREATNWRATRCRRSREGGLCSKP